MVNSITAALLDGLFPNYCVLCGLRSNRGVPLCRDCQGELQPNHSCCHRCAIPLPQAADASEPRLCGKCQYSPPPFHRVIAPWIYNEQLAYIIQRWKYRGERQLTPLLGSLWLQQVGRLNPVHMLLPVPLHSRRLWQRGFNQSDLLCRQLRCARPSLAAAALENRLVRRHRATATQSGSNASQRTRNLRGAFTALRPCDNLRIAIVDDVLTTGATASAVASVLHAAGARHIEVWCLARTPAPGD